MRVWTVFVASLCAGILWGRAALAQDWPAWRYDSGHTASAVGEMPEKMDLQWTRVYSPRTQVWNDPLNLDLMQYDRIFEPVAKDGRLYVGFNDADKVVAIDLKDGRELWTFYAEGPVRFPAVAWRDVVFFASDDGFLYCLDGATGQLRWKYQAAPAGLKVIGNERVISAWPVRGGPVVHEDQVYFAASIWPFMGTFIYCLDASTGELKWVNDSTASQYIKQPHSAPSFAGVGPQGTFTVAGDYLLVPGGRSIPAAFDRKTGELRHFLLDEGGKGNGGSLVLARGNEYYVHTRVRGVRAFDLATGNKTAFMTNEPVLDDPALPGASLFAAERKSLVAAPTAAAAGSDDEEGGSSDAATAGPTIPVLRGYNAKKEVVWELPNIDGSGDVIKVGQQLYVAGGQQITALTLKADGSGAEVAWTAPAPADVQRLLAASGRLLAVTLDGRILCYGRAGEISNPQVLAAKPQPRSRAWSGLAPELEKLIELKGQESGYLLWFGDASEAVIDQLLSQTRLDLVIVDPNAERVGRLRQIYDAAGVGCKRLSFQVGSIESYQAPPYIAHVVVVSGRAAGEVREDRDVLRRAYDSVRPYGGMLALWPSIESAADNELLTILRDADLENADVRLEEGLMVAERVGALDGAADWTHQYGNIANTVKSNDARVKLPLGLLWFGGSSNLDVLPRHGHGPPEQVVGGRLYIEGLNSLNCRDVYTGRVLWKRTFGDLGTYDVYYDVTYRDTPLDPAYNQVHIPGANGRGTNFVATEEAVYILEGDSCHVLDLETGETRRKITLPESVAPENRQWAYIGVYKDVLLAGAGFANYGQRHSISFEDTDGKLGGNSKGFGSKSYDVAASAKLMAFNRHTGELLWEAEPRHSFLHNGIVAGDGKIFCLDKLPAPVEERLKRRGLDAPATYRIVGLDVATGAVAWEQSEKIFGTWLGYSEEYHLLLHAGAAATDRMSTEVGQGMAVYRGENGDLVWRVEDRDYSGPCILHHDAILTNANAYRLNSGVFSLLDGSPKLIENPITKEKQPWQLSRSYGCNTIIASENMLTFRSGAAGFYDLSSQSGTGNLGGFKSGCTSNLIVANGVLNAPDYTRTCSCGYQNQTSLALVHMPQMEMWTVNHVARLSKPGQPIQRLGLNFGAPGDRRDENGTLWIDYPVLGGDSVELDVRVEGAANYYRRNSLGFTGPGAAWIGSSGVVNAQKIVVPLTIKQLPDEMRLTVQDGADDGEEQPDGTVSVGSSDLELVTDAAQQTVAMRFNRVHIDQNRKILQAHLQLTCDEKVDEKVAADAEAAKAEVVLGIEDTANSAPLQEAAKNLSSRALHAEKVSWALPVWEKEGEAGDKQKSPEVTNLLRHVINRADWASGNALTLVVTGTGKRVAKAAEGGAETSPALLVKLEPLPLPEPPPAPYTVRLFFAEPEAIDTGERVFDVVLQGTPVLTDMDIIQVAGQPRKTIVQEFTKVMLTNELTIEMRPKHGQPLLNGVEIVRE